MAAHARTTSDAALPKQVIDAINAESSLRRSGGLGASDVPSVHWTAKEHALTKLPSTEVKKLLGFGKSAEWWTQRRPTPLAAVVAPNGVNTATETWTVPKCGSAGAPASAGTFSWLADAPGCINYAMDQQACGSCWAFSAASVFTDRTCLAAAKELGTVVVNVNAPAAIADTTTPDQYKTYKFSPQPILSCARDAAGRYPGCDGVGDLAVPWNYLVHTGTVLANVQHYTAASAGGTVTPCQELTLPVADLRKASATVPQFQVGQAGPPTTAQEFADNIQRMKAEIIANGPIQTGFTVFHDLTGYASGIYKPTTSEQMGGHAVEIVGFGTEEVAGGEKLPYWLVKNSWGPGWGDNGFFKRVMYTAPEQVPSTPGGAPVLSFEMIAHAGTGAVPPS